MLNTSKNNTTSSSLTAIKTKSILETIKKNDIKKELKHNNVKAKHFPSSVREWNNSIYLYNKNNINLIPSITVDAMKIVRSFFNLYNRNLERKIRTKRLLLRLKRLSSNRIFLSNGEFKHNNNNVLINIYLFNRQKHNYIYKLRSVYLNRILMKNINKNLIESLKYIYDKGQDSIKKVNKNKYLLMRSLDILEKNKKYKINTFKALSNYMLFFNKNIIYLTMKKLHLYFLYKQLIYINRSKLNYTYLHLLKKHLETLYSKNVEFNLINLNRFYLNSDILSESVKLKITRNRRKMHNILNRLKNKIKIRKKNIFLRNDIVNIEGNKLGKTTFLKYTILNKLKYKYLTGFRLETKGRLNKRFTASRSLSKLRYNGNLLNMDSSYKHLSSVILKGNLKSNVQYTKLKSKTRIGSFGIKGWVSSN